MEHNRSPQGGGGVAGVDGVGVRGQNSLSVRGRGSEGTLSNKRCQVKAPVLLSASHRPALRQSTKNAEEIHTEKNG